MSMIQAFGLEIDVKTMKVTYHPDKIRYGKIIIMSDADVDGAHIKNLFYTFIWNFCPQLIRDGYVAERERVTKSAANNCRFEYVAEC